jgi:hypothetical protein
MFERAEQPALDDEAANHRLAVAEIVHEVDHYESRQSGLGAELEDEVDAVLELIMRLPYARRSGSNARIVASPCSAAFRSPSRTRSSATKL